MGHISEPDESSVSLNKTAHSNRFVQMAPTALKAGTESLLWQIRHVKAYLPLQWESNRRKHINIELHHRWCVTIHQREKRKTEEASW